MKRLVLLLCFPAMLAIGSDLSEVKSVYLLRMSKGFDQYLANRLTNQHVFQIVTDPKLADAILTDQIGETFEAKLNELFPPLEHVEPVEKPKEPAKPEKPAEKAAAKPEKNTPPSKTVDVDNTMSLFSEASTKLAPLTSSFGRAKGTLFLVDAKSKEVVWSTYDPPKDATSNQMDRTANDIVSRLKRDLKKK
jgi:hypothetical protein